MCRQALVDLGARPHLAFPREKWHTTCPDGRVVRIRERLLRNAREIDVERALQLYRGTGGAGSQRGR